ncbi:MAG: RNA polymerase sigma factor (sigma-70 family) [Planctomycetota bacterium]|jgi:RNA polymerase sigma factor (sigma-70 family)
MTLQPTPSEPNWIALIPRVIAGDGDSLDTWYRAEWPVVYRLCLGLLADHSAAEDAAQDSMLRLTDRLATWDAARSYGPWRTSVVLNLCRDCLRRRTTRSEAAAFEAGNTRPLPDPSVHAERAEVQAALEEALLELTDREREAFVLRDLEGMSTEHVADAMAIAASSVRSLLTLARRRLRNLLAHRLPESALDGGGNA